MCEIEKKLGILFLHGMMIKCKSIYPGKSANGYENYRMAQIKGMNSTPGCGLITMELKVVITLRLLAGASYLDMIWCSNGDCPSHD